MFGLYTRPLFGRKNIVVAQIEGYRGAHGPVIFDKESGRELIVRGCNDFDFYTTTDRDALLGALEASGLKETFEIFKAAVLSDWHSESSVCEVRPKDGGFELKAWGRNLHQDMGVFTDLHLAWNRLVYWMVVHSLYSHESAYAGFRQLVRMNCPPASVEYLSNELMRWGGYHPSLVAADNIRW